MSNKQKTVNLRCRICNKAAQVWVAVFSELNAFVPLSSTHFVFCSIIYNRIEWYKCAVLLPSSVQKELDLKIFK